MNGEELKEAFEKRAKNGQLSLDQAGDVLNDWSISLSVDCEQCMRFFDREQSPLPPGRSYLFYIVLE